MPSTLGIDAFNGDIEAKVEIFKLAFIEQVKSNSREDLRKN